MPDIQRKKHCDHCHLSFGLREKREPFGEMAVHKDPCLTTLRHRASQQAQGLSAMLLSRQKYDNPCTG